MLLIYEAHFLTLFSLPSNKISSFQIIGRFLFDKIKTILDFMSNFLQRSVAEPSTNSR